MFVFGFGLSLVLVSFPSLFCAWFRLCFVLGFGFVLGSGFGLGLRLVLTLVYAWFWL